MLKALTVQVTKCEVAAVKDVHGIQTSRFCINCGVQEQVVLDPTLKHLHDIELRLYPSFYIYFFPPFDAH